MQTLWGPRREPSKCTHTCAGPQAAASPHAIASAGAAGMSVGASIVATVSGEASVLPESGFTTWEQPAARPAMSTQRRVKLTMRGG